MFPSTTSTTTLTRMARSTRQSGLKKPRPLRSVSLQEQPSDNDVKKMTPERQLSTPVSSDEVSTGNKFPVCEGISAMSALIASQAGADTSKSPTNTIGKKESPSQETRQSFDRQDSNSSYNSCLDSESGSSFYSMSRQNSISTEHNSSFHKQRGSTPTSFTQNQLTEISKGVDFNSNNIGLNGSFQDTSPLSLSRSDDDFANIPLVTLLTAQGEKLILTGKSMPTILNASKILVREMGASICSMRFEDLNEDSDRSPRSQMKNSSPSPPPEPDEQNQKDEKVIRYSKDELLALSECDTARKPPANWNILIHTHSDCCLPAHKMVEYFEAIDFHAHDGTLVMEDRRIQDRRDRGGERDIRGIIR